ncbi:energy transducer TonB [Pedobacter sp. UYP1]|uniref:energy transducer TonB n=1 Tax=Pedobacter sp. UYP1 TaxID=1756396 RepID=UPI0033949AED
MNNDWLDIELLEDYLDGKLDSKAMHKIEKQALEDPFVAQALAGLSESRGRAVQNVSLLQKQLYERIAQQQVTKKETVFTWQRLSVAAAAAVMFISVSIMFFMKDREKREEMAKNQPRKVEVNIAPSPAQAVIDSAKNDIYAANVPAAKTKPITAGQVTPSGVLQNDGIGERAVQPYAMQAAPVKPADSTITADVPVQAMARMSKVVAKEAVSTAVQSVSTPVGGWVNLDTYLNDHNKLRGTGDRLVELSFLVDNEGNPADLKVTKGIDKQFDEEAIRLIKEGPKWEQPKDKESRVVYTVAF